MVFEVRCLAPQKGRNPAVLARFPNNPFWGTLSNIYTLIGKASSRLKSKQAGCFVLRSIGRMRVVTRKQAEIAVRDHLHGLIGTEPFLVSSGYSAHFRDWKRGLLDGLRPDLIEPHFQKGSGGELSRPVPKLSAAYSSSALCVNAFGPARESPDWLDFKGLKGFTEFAFEGKLPTGLGGTPPNLDFVARSPKRVLAVESKFLETLTPVIPEFAPVYEAAFQNCRCPRLHAAFTAVRSGSEPFAYLDVAQLLKHALGLINLPRREPLMTGKALTLGFVFWEPTNHDELSPYDQLRSELARFSSLMDGGKIEFVSIDYPSLWKRWLQAPQKASHASRLIERYSHPL